MMKMRKQMARLNKYLAECGVCSRRDADKIIAEGVVTVNGTRAVNGVQVGEGDKVCVNGKEVKPVSSKVVLAYNKPIGVTCTEKDSHAKLTITQAVKYPIRLTYAGRLDKDSEGLIILTNDGELIQRMMKGANRHEKEYVVKTDKEINDDFIKKMSEGIYLKEIGETTRACTVEKIGKYTFRIILTQGLNRQIRRMCESLGYKVKSLERIRVMNIKLGNLKRGEYRELKGEELSKLYEMCGMEVGGI
jgi:23S rRNA pseudouridine2604 synthase